jgi:dipeptidyl aminopeptidase/acylaminoacyl peptidase
MKAQQRAAFALALLAALLALPASPSRADALDDAIAAVRVQEAPPLLPRSFILARDRVREAELSPDGQRIAYVTVRGEIKQLRLVSADGTGRTLLFSSKILKSLYWSRDSRFIFLETERGIGVVDLAVPQAPAHLVNLDATKGDVFHGVDQAHPHAFLVSLARDSRDSHDLYRVTPDGERTLLYRHDTHVADFLPGSNGTPAFALQLNGNLFDVRRIDGDRADTLLGCDLVDSCGLISHNQATGKLYMRGRLGEDLLSLFAVDTATGERTLLHQDPSGRFDLNAVKVDARTGVPALVGYRTDHTAFYGLTAETRAALDRLHGQLGASYYHVVPSADLSRLLVVDQSSGRQEPAVFLYDIASDRLHRRLAHETAPDDPAMRFAPRIPIWYTVSDGMHQQGYVTLPLGRDPASVPLVVMPHGGPWNRVDGSFNSMAQFLASRGYAVFEPNFRASTGFGAQYMTAARRAFGDGRVQQDITDGMNHVLSRGVGDRERLAIVGHSFGGFSVLGALAFTPDTFRLGVAGAPPSDLAQAIVHFRKMAGSPDFDLSYAFYKDQAVDPDDPMDRKRSYEKSPDYHWRKVTRPLYVWAGGKDPKVSVLDVRDYVLRLQVAGKPVTYMEEPRAGHSPEAAIAREAYLYMVEKALADHLGGEFEAHMNSKLLRHMGRIVMIDENALLATAPVP